MGFSRGPGAMIPTTTGTVDAVSPATMVDKAAPSTRRPARAMASRRRRIAAAGIVLAVTAYLVTAVVFSLIYIDSAVAVERVRVSDANARERGQPGLRVTLDATVSSPILALNLLALNGVEISALKCNITN